jgi:hypothetical protein
MFAYPEYGYSGTSPDEIVTSGITPGIVEDFSGNPVPDPKKNS